MHLSLLFLLTCGLSSFSNQSNEQFFSNIHQPVSQIAMSQVDSADFIRCPSCGIKYHRSVGCRTLGCDRNRQKR